MSKDSWSGGSKLLQPLQVADAASPSPTSLHIRKEALRAALPATLKQKTKN